MKLTNAKKNIGIKNDIQSIVDDLKQKCYSPLILSPVLKIPYLAVAILKITK